MYKDHAGLQLLGAVGNITKCNGLVHRSVGFFGNTKVLKGWAAAAAMAVCSGTGML